VRGGGRAAAEGLAIEVSRLAELPIPLQRRVLRHAAGRLGAAPDFDGTEALRNLALTGRAGQKCVLAGFEGERTHRELRLSGGAGTAKEVDSGAVYLVEISGEVVAPKWGIRVRIVRAGDRGENHPSGAETPRGITEPGGTTEAVPFQSSASAGAIPEAASRRAVLRAWKAGDRVRLRHSGSPRKVKEVLERMHVSGSARADWPVLELEGRILWMQGVQVEPEPGIEVVVSALEGI